MTEFTLLFRRFTLMFVLFLLVPIITWTIGWHWEAEQKYNLFDPLLFIITETGSAPYFAALVSLIFAITLSRMCKKPQHHWVLIFLSVFLLQAGTQVIKSSLKMIYQEPRPYMSYMIEKGVELEPFYAESRRERGLIIADNLLEETHTPKYVQNHWENETGFSFPSGHTIFAVTWAFIFVGFLTRERHPKARIIMGVISLWAILMMISRLRFGMHFPIDLFTSTLFAYPIALFFFLFLAKRDEAVDENSLEIDAENPFKLQ